MSQAPTAQKPQRRNARCPFPGCKRYLEHPGDHTPTERTKPAKSRGHRNPSRTHLPKKYEDFCQLMFETNNATQSAIRVGLSGYWGRMLVHRPAIQERIREIREEYQTNLAAKRIEDLPVGNPKVTEEFADQILMEIMAKGQKKPYQIKAIELAYEKMKLIDRSRGGAQAFAGVNVAPAALGGATMADIYKAKWLRDKEQTLAQQLEGEYNQSQKALAAPASPE